MSAADVEALVDRIEHGVAAAGGELSAERISEACLAGLRELDFGAYLQFLGTMPAPKPEFAESAPGLSVRAGGQHASFPVRGEG